MNLTDMQRMLTMDEPLNPELRPYVQNSKGIGPMLHHPLVIEMFFVPGKCALLNAQYEMKKQALAKAEENGNWSSYIFLHERPYRVRALRSAMRRGCNPAHAQVAATWLDSENIWQHRASWFEIWSGLSSPRLTMNEEEAAHYASLPETITIHRGIRGRRLSRRGLSWTLDRERAVWFARRFTKKENQPVVLSAEVKKANILALFDGRNESEIVILPKHQHVVSETAI